MELGPRVGAPGSPRRHYESRASGDEAACHGSIHRSVCCGRSDGRRVSVPPLQAFAVLALGVLGTSWSAIFVRWANVPGGTSAFYRVIIAEVTLVAFLVLRRKPVAV